MRRAVAVSVAISLAVAVSAFALAQAGKGKKPPKEYNKSTQEAFFKDVREARGPGQPASGTSRPASVAGTTNPGGTTTAPVSPAGGAGFSKLISAETLEDLIKAAPAEIGDSVDAESKFNTGHNKIRKLYNTLAIAFNVIAQYDGEVRFKEPAAGLRDMLARSARNSKTVTTQAWREAQKRSQDLQELIRGGNVTVVEAEKEMEFSKIADRPPIMQRLEDALDRGLAPMSSDEGTFKANKDKVRKEAEIMAVLARAIQDPGFDYADDTGYRGFAQALELHALEVVQGANQDSYSSVRTAVGNIGKQCSQCHKDFR